MADILHQIHDFKALCAEDHDSGLQKHDIERLRRQEKVPITAEPIRLWLPEAKPTPYACRRFRSFIDLIDNGFDDMKNTVDLEAA